MIEKEVEVRTVDGVADGVLIKPDDAGRWPGVLHLTDIRGVRPTTLEMARRLAGEGYVVLTPNVFYRTGRPPFTFTPGFADDRSKQLFADLTRPFTPEASAEDASAYVDFLAHSPGVAEGPMGVVGYCFTGGVALRVAAARPDKVAAAASFHGGGLFTNAPTSPHLVLPRVKARLYFGHATEDGSMPAESIESLDRALEAWGGSYESETYAGCSHGWTVPDNRAYDEPEAERGFAKLQELFAHTLRLPR
jgi:carboxymethylenebutenolidase